MTIDNLTDRKDLATSSSLFKSWLKEHAVEDPELIGPFAPIYRIADDKRFPLEYKFDVYVDIIEAYTDPATSDALIEVLVQAEAEWRVDSATKKDAREALGLRRDRKDKSFSPVPIPVLKCGFTFKSGNLCGKDCVPGSARCEKHGGALLDPLVRQSMLMMAYAKLVEGTDVAVDALVDIARSSRSDIARVQASKEILDRAGITPDVRITVTTEDSEEDRMFRLKRQLEATRERLMASSTETTISDRAAEIETANTPALPASTFDETLEVDPPEVVRGELVTNDEMYP